MGCAIVTPRINAINRIDSLRTTDVTRGFSGCPVLLQGLVGYWALEEAGGTRFDSRGTNDLTDNNSVGQAVGKIGNAAQFVAASGEFLEALDNDFLSVGGTSFTIASWVYLDSTIDQVIASKYTNSSADSEFILRILSGRYRFTSIQSNGGNSSVQTAAGLVVTNTWTYVIGWYDLGAGTVSIQVNNGTVVSATGATFPPLNSTSSFRIGAWNPSAQFFNGRIDEVALWKRVLIASERTALHNSGSGLSYADLLTYTG